MNSKAKFIRLHARLFLAIVWCRLRKKKQPLNVFICVTNRCNLRCKYCYGVYFKRQGWREFTTGELLDLVDTLAEMGTRLIQFQGGEPLLRQDLPEIMDRAKQHGIMVDLVTNGILLRQSPEVAARINSACFSMDGPRELMDAYRGQGAYDATIDAIRYCREMRIPARANSVLTNETKESDIDYLVALARAENFEINFCPPYDFIPLEEAPEYRPMEIDDDHLRLLIRAVIKHKEAGGPVQFSRSAFEWALKWPFPYSKFRAKREELPSEYQPVSCIHGDYVVFVDSDGRLYPCCNLWHDPEAPNIHDLGFREAYRRISRHGCDACYVFSYIDRNSIFNLRPRILFNYFSNMMKDVLGRMGQNIKKG